MKKYSIALTPRARTSIIQIVQYLEKEASKSISQKVQKGIMDTIRGLATLPESHSVFEEISDNKVIYRRILKWNYKIVFTVNNDLLEVVVVQVYHGSRSLQWLKKKLKS